MHRRNFIRLVGGGRSTDLPAPAVEAWDRPTADAEPRSWASGHSILAPSSHNRQPWLVDLGTPNALTLYMNRERLLPETDPLFRQKQRLRRRDEALRGTGRRSTGSPPPRPWVPPQRRGLSRPHLRAPATGGPSHGLQIHPMSQAPQEFAEMKPHYDALHQSLTGRSNGASVLQMFCHVGHCAPQPHTPRRALGQTAI